FWRDVRLLAIVALGSACAVGSPGIGDDPSAIGDVPANPGRPPIANALADGAFELAAWDSGLVANRSLEHAPWGAGSWGVSAAVFDDGDDHALGGAHVATFDDAGYLFAREDRGRYGF